MPTTALWNKSAPSTKAQGTSANPRAVARGIGLVSIILAVAALFIFFLWFNPSRVGELTVTAPDGSAVTVRVANSNEISELIRSGLKNKKTAAGMTISLLSIIEGLAPDSELAKKLVALVERRQPPFSMRSVPVKLLYDPQVPGGLAASCEGSPFLARNIVVYAIKNDGEMVYNSPAHVDVHWTFPCPAGGGILRMNSTNIDSLKPSSQYKMFAKFIF